MLKNREMKGYKAELEVEALTPIFMRGADQREVEIRASSIKGVMRWWFRALAGNYFGDDIESLRKAENYVFGSTERRSRIVAGVYPTKLSLKNRPLPMVWRWGRRLQQEAISEDTKFSIILKSHDEFAIKLAYISTWAMIVLGGIGARHTRGAGSLMIKEIDKDFKLDLKFSFKNLERELPSEIDNAIFKTTTLLPILSRKLGLKEHSNGNICLRYSALSPKCARVYLWKNDLDKIYYESNDPRSPESLLDKFEELFKNSTASRFGYKEYVFGLPRGRINERRMSPMHVGLIKTEEGSFLKIVTFRTSEFRPNFKGGVSWDVIGMFLENELKATKIWGYVNK